MRSAIVIEYSIKIKIKWGAVCKLIFFLKIIVILAFGIVISSQKHTQNRPI